MFIALFLDFLTRVKSCFQFYHKCSIFFLQWSGFIYLQLWVKDTAFGGDKKIEC